MHCLLVEDGVFKRDRVVEFLRSGFNGITVDACGSYSSAIRYLSNNEYDLIILDMSLPTFDNQDGQDGGDFRVYGGLDIARKIKRKSINTKFVFLTQYKSFIDGNNLEELSDIDNQTREKFGGQYCGYIYYENAGFEWKDKLSEVLLESE